jgi:hypothetical protein
MIHKSSRAPLRQATKGSIWAQGKHAAHYFIQKKYKWLVLIGSVIIALSISVRDRIHERERDLTEAIAEKENFGSLHELATITAMHLDDLTRLVLEHDQGGSLKKVSPGVISGMDEYHKALNEASLANAESASLAEVLPQQVELKRQIDATSRTLQDLQGAYERMRYISQRDDIEHETELEEKMAQLRPIQETIADTRKNIEMEIGRLKILYAREYILVSTLSYALIALGVGLSLGGQLIAKPGEAPELGLGG